MTLKTTEYPKILSTLKELGTTDREIADALGVRSTKTIERIRKRLPSSLKPFIAQPRLLRALLEELEQAA